MSSDQVEHRAAASLPFAWAAARFECWIVDQEQESVLVIRRDGSRQVYGEDSEVPLTAFGGGSMRVHEIFL